MLKLAVNTSFILYLNSFDIGVIVFLFVGLILFIHAPYLRIDIGLIQGILAPMSNKSYLPYNAVP